MKFKPAFGGVLIKIHKLDVLDFSRTNEGTAQGKVVAIGPGRWSEAGHRIPMSFRVGQMVVFDKQCVDFTLHDGDDTMVLVDENGVLGVYYQ